MQTLSNYIKESILSATERDINLDEIIADIKSAAKKIRQTSETAASYMAAKWAIDRDLFNFWSENKFTDAQVIAFSEYMKATMPEFCMVNDIEEVENWDEIEWVPQGSIFSRANMKAADEINPNTPVNRKNVRSSNSIYSFFYDMDMTDLLDEYDLINLPATEKYRKQLREVVNIFFKL